MRIAIYLSILLCFRAPAFSQMNVTPVTGLATKEVYDLLVDRKGFVWVGHELGLSRLNGSFFNNFSNPRQASLSVTNLLEDKYGRIWCHNFSGQIFYVENGQMKLLSAYDNSKEREFPTMVICGDELVVTSAIGLFICDLKTLASRYIKGNYNFNTKTITAIGKTAVVYDGRSWFAYEKNRNIYPLKTSALKNYVFGYFLQPQTYQDTIFFLNPVDKLIQFFVLEKDVLKLVREKYMNDYINGITVDKNEVWINCRSKTVDLNNPSKVIKNMNLSDLITDKQGNTWYSSLNKGLNVKYKATGWNKVKLLSGESNEIIRTIDNYNGHLIYGTQKGNIFFTNNKPEKIIRKIELPSASISGGIEYSRIKKGKIIMGTSIFHYILDPNTYKINGFDYGNARDADVYENMEVIAGSSALHIVPFEAPADQIAWNKSVMNHFKGFIWKPSGPWIDKRCRAVRILPRGIMIASFTDGLFQIDSTGIHPVYYNKLPVYCTSLEYAAGKLFISTPGNGLLLQQEKDSLRNITTADGLSSNAILRIKAVGNHLWIFEDANVQVMDIQSQRISDIDIPGIGGAEVYDVTEVNNKAYISSNQGLYEVPMSSSLPIDHPELYLDFAIVNDGDTLLKPNPALNYSQNDIQFYLSVPWYSNTSSDNITYRLIGGNDKWRSLRRNDKIIRFVSLMPGDYTFEAYAVLENGTRSHTVSFHFYIRKPWWQQWWFIALIIVLLAGLFYFIYRYRLSQVLKVERIRRSISTDLHDDIGATLSSINIYTELAKTETSNKEYLQRIQDHSKEVIEKLDDLVWSINPRNDTCEQLINRMHSFADPLLQAASVHFVLNYDLALYQLDLDVRIKQNIYLIFKEIINNIVKYAKATECKVELRYAHKRFFLSVQDNGIGFDTEAQSHRGNGLTNIKERVLKMKGKISVRSTPGLGTKIDAILPVS